jgi:hypothetical protein
MSAKLKVLIAEDNFMIADMAEELPDCRRR